MNLRTAVQVRSGRSQWVYILCIVLVAALAVPSIATGGDFVAGLPYLALVIACVIQFLRPTLLLWALLTIGFLGYTASVALHFKTLTTGDFVIFLSVGLIPTVALLLAWPLAASDSK